MNKFLLIGFLVFYPFIVFSINADNQSIGQYDVVWSSQSSGPHESMPCGGGDIGLNVWVEQNDIFFYVARSGSFDENNAFLKSGRIRVKLFPNPFKSNDFSQELNLEKGFVEIKSRQASVIIWVDIFQPIIHLEMTSSFPIEAEVFYENWRYRDRLIREGEGNQNSYKWAVPEGLVTHKDSVFESRNDIYFFHKNSYPTVFDVTVTQQKLNYVKDNLYNPLNNLIFGGKLCGDHFRFNHSGYGIYLNTDYAFWSIKSERPAKTHHVLLALHTDQQENINAWETDLDNIVRNLNLSSDRRKTQHWWSNFWNRSFVIINNDKPNSESWKVARNYQLFRYMLACNAYGKFPTKFNGGLFTFDPCFVDKSLPYTPDYRKWGGGTFTAQNQRLVYYPMLKSGDFDMMKSQFDFYLRLLKNAEIRSKTYWRHSGACFVEQLENFGLPNPSEYGWKRPDYFDPGIEYNAWLEYEWDTVLEFCSMILDMKSYNDADITRYLPLIKSCLTFFDEHYQWLAKMRGIKPLDEKGNLVLYPGSACETYKMAYNATSTISALKVVLEKIISITCDKVEKAKWIEMLQRIPPLTLVVSDGKKMIAPAKMWERVNNVESPQLYPVFPWRIYGIGKDDLEAAINTYFYDADVVKFRDYVGWKQYNIFAACLGLVDEAEHFTLLKMADGPFRFPAFWGPGFDWVPDHNWGGSGMIGLQEMLIQSVKEKIYLFPAWPKDWNVHFKLHIDNNTTVEAELIEGKLHNLIVSPFSRTKDIVNCIQN